MVMVMVMVYVIHIQKKSQCALNKFVNMLRILFIVHV